MKRRPKVKSTYSAKYRVAITWVVCETCDHRVIFEKVWRVRDHGWKYWICQGCKHRGRGRAGSKERRLSDFLSDSVSKDT